MNLYQIPINQPPFEPTEIEAIAITNIGYMFGHLFVLVFFMLLMLYLFMKIVNFLPILVVYTFSLLIGMESFTHLHTAFSPLLELFFLMFQTTLFLLTSFNVFENRKRKLGR